MTITRTMMLVAFASLVFGQDAPPAVEKKGGGRAPRPKPPGVSTPGVKREMTTITPTAVYSIPGTPDWQVTTAEAQWVSNGPKNTLHRMDPKTSKSIAIEVGKRPCSGLAAGFGSVWVPLCGDRPNVENGAKPGLARVDIKTNRLVATIPLGIANSEGGIAVSPDAVWMTTDMKGVLSRIDPAANKVTAEIE